MSSFCEDIPYFYSLFSYSAFSLIREHLENVKESVEENLEKTQKQIEEKTDDVKKALNEAGDEIEKAKDKNPFNLETL